MENQTKKFLKGINGVLLLEDLFPHHIRKTILKLFGSVTLVLAIVMIFSGGIYEENIRGGLFLCLSITLFIFTLESYFYSILTRAEQGDYFVSFDIGEILFYDEDNDLTRALLFSDVGDEAMQRLGFDEKKIKEFLTNREKGVFSSVLEEVTEHISYSAFFELVYKNDKGLQDFLFSHGIQEKEFLGTLIWVVGKNRKRIREERFWSKENLGKIPGIGKNWSYGETYVLDRYGDDLTESTTSYDSGYVKSKEAAVNRLQAVLTRGRGSNAVVVSDDEASRLDVITILAQKINQGTIMPTLQHKRIFVINPNLIIESTNDKISFEREFSTMLSEAVHAQNVIIAIPYFSSFIKSAETLGADIMVLLLPYIKSQFIHIVALDSKKDYHEFLSAKDSITENFEMIQTDNGDDSSMISMLLEEAEDIESVSNALITYPAILSVIASANRYFDPAQKAQKCKEMLVEAVQVAFGRGSKMVLKTDVLSSVEMKTGIPTAKPEGEEREKLLHLEELLHKRIIGQNEAVKVVAEALKRSRAGVENPDRPIGTFLFLGPTGVGKTETTKALASIVFDKESAISRFDMGEYRDNMALERLIGSFGSGKSGTLSIALRENPYGVLLLDEFEKTTTDVINLFLRIFDEGVFTDSEGRKINAKNNVIIATSNAGSELIWDIVQNGGDLLSEKDKVIEKIINDGIFKPELLNRFDAVVLFHPLLTEDLRKIAELMMQKFAKRMREKGVMIDSTSAFLDYLVGKGNDPKFGARPMNRAITEEVEKLIANKIIEGGLSEGGKVIFDIDSAGLVVLR